MIFYIIGGITAVIIFVVLKDKLLDKPHREIEILKSDIKKLQRLHREEIIKLDLRMRDGSNLHIQENEFIDIALSYAFKELTELCNDNYAFLGVPKSYYDMLDNSNTKEYIKRRFCEAIDEQYKYRYLIYLYPEFEKIFKGTEVVSEIQMQPTKVPKHMENLFDVVNILRSNKKSEELIYWKNRVSFLESSKSNLTAIPYMAEIVADYETYGLEYLAKELDWGYSYKRAEKVKAIREIRKDAKSMVEKNKESQYQLAYILKLFPNLEYVIETDYKGVLITNIKLSSMAKKMASYLKIEYIEDFEAGIYPCIKCNLGRDENGEITKIYHLPFDQQYDSAKINKKGEFYAMTVAEAEAAGFRRAFKWFGGIR